MEESNTNEVEDIIVDDQEEVSEDDRLSELKDDEIEKPKDEKAKEAKPDIKRLADEDLDKVITVKINGEVKEMPVREAIKLTQLEQASRAKMQEAAQTKKQIETQMKQIVSLAKTNPKEFFKLIGVDPYEFSESTLAEKLELLEMSEEERKILEYEEKLKKYEETEKERQEREEKEKESSLIARESETLDKEISTAWKESGLPMRKEFVTAIAQEMYGASIRKENLTASDAALRVKDNWHRSLKETISNLDAQAIHGLFGDDVLEKLRDFDIKRVTKKQVASQKFNRPTSHVASSNKKSQPLSEQEYAEWKESLLKGL